MSRIKVVMHSKTVGYSGTDKTCQFFAKYIDKTRFEPFVLYRDNDLSNTRLDIVKSYIGTDNVIPYIWKPGKRSGSSPYLPEEDNFFDIVKSINPDIIHHHFSGYNEWPVFKYLSPAAKIVTTNIFGYNDILRQSDLTIYIADYVRNRALSSGSIDGPVIYNPIEQPTLDVTKDNKELCRDELLAKYKIPHNTILMGRVGRPDNFDPIALKAFAEIEKKYSNVWYIVVNPCQNWLDYSAKLGIQNIRFADAIVNDHDLSKFYMGLDIYAHARHDGEMCPTNIQEAMMHGLPVVSHESGIYNGQSEIIGDAGFVVPVGDWVAYRDILEQLVLNEEFANEDETDRVRLRDYFGRTARRRAMRYFEASIVNKQLEKCYDWVLS